ncbi:hypothetical protein [Mycobacterium aquaticum]|uniref:Uncharacterized protein n=1 Tax=Mycobacterium aquaticum TaxID=1927124 RepID=A0A1X0A559_9MYCO|nr:hypothetical protein [Mycobacterium aquaticum]ORA25209.1 hypothetical protein BST13_33360 [Mycobacterium aquaticum]
MSELMRLIQSHLDRYGVTRATFAKRIGTTPQTVQNWKTRSTTMPKAEHLLGIANETGIPYLAVVDAALMDAGYRSSLADDIDALKVRLARYIRESDRGVEEIQEYLSQPYFPTDYDLKNLRPGMTQEDLNAFIDRLIARTDAARYGNDELFDREFLHQYLTDHLTKLNEENADDMEAETEPSAPETINEDQEAGDDDDEEVVRLPSRTESPPKPRRRNASEIQDRIPRPSNLRQRGTHKPGIDQ